MNTVKLSMVVLFSFFSVFCLAAETTSIDNKVLDSNGGLIGTVTADGQFLPVRDIGGDAIETQTPEEIALASAYDPMAIARSSSPADLNLYSDHTIDRISTSESASYSPPFGSVYIVGRIDRYHLSNGSSWSSGAGSFSYGTMSYRSRSRQGSGILYQFDSSGLILRPTDYNSGNHAAHFQLNAFGPLVLTAVEGATTAKINGLAEIILDEPANYADSRFHPLSSPVGSIIPFETTFSLKNGAVFTDTTFEESFNYSLSAEIDLLNVTQSVELDYITIFGPTVVPSESNIDYTAVGVYVNGAVSDLTEDVVWSVNGDGAVSVNNRGQLATAETLTETAIVLVVNYSDGQTSKQVQKTITVIPKATTSNATDWSMYQASTKHNGYLPATLWPEQFEMLWQVQLPNTSLNRITAADGKVFTSGVGSRLDVVDGQTGALLWSKTSHHRHGSFPSFANGIVYMQWGNHSGDTYLEAYDADTGEVMFKAPHSAQWENYYAPTVYEGRVYINGGSYGGAYCFDAFTGQQYWFKSLAQDDGWTPAVDAEYAYVYVGGRLSALDKETGNAVFSISRSGTNRLNTNTPTIGEHHNVVVTDRSKLISFDTVNRSIGFERSDKYSGQPCIADNVIYVINDGDIEAIDEVTGQLIWRYDTSDSFIGEMIVTDSHIIARTSGKTCVISLEDRQLQWQYPVSGHMAMSDDRLYVAGSNGYLTAISMPNLMSNQIMGFEIKGPESIDEYAVTGFQAAVEYEGGFEWFVTTKTDWSISGEPVGIADIDQTGRVTTYDKDGVVTISASFSTGNQTVHADKTIFVVHPVTDYFVNNQIGNDEGFGITPDLPFAGIQRAIVEAWDGDTVYVEGGIYEETIDFLGKKITVKAVNDAVTLLGPNPAPLQNTLITEGAAATAAYTPVPQTFACVVFDHDENEESILENFIVTGVFAGIYCGNGSPTIKNVTSVRNGYGLAVWGNGSPTIINSIFRGNSIADCFGGTASYSCVERGSPGEGNITDDPLFADIVHGDYHLLSERGRYHPSLQQWVLDDVTSPCIATGSPESDDSNERMPNGGRINMGAYGGLYNASMASWPLEGDINRDGIVNMGDYAVLAEDWLVEIK